MSKCVNVNDNAVTTIIPVRQSIQNSLDEIIRETTEYLKENNGGNNVSSAGSGRRRIPVEYTEETISSMNGCTERGNHGEEMDYYEGDVVARKTCLNVTCKFFGSPELENYCSQCYRGRFENLAIDSSSRK